MGVYYGRFHHNLADREYIFEDIFQGLEIQTIPPQLTQIKLEKIKRFELQRKNNLRKPIMHWSFLRLVILYRDKHSCRKCGAKTHLDIHHRDHNYTHNSFWNLVVLCESCHYKHHRECIHVKDPKIIRAQRYKKSILLDSTKIIDNKIYLARCPNGCLCFYERFDEVRKCKLCGRSFDPRTNYINENDGTNVQIR